MGKDGTVSHAHWDDLSQNTREQLLQILGELEIPYCPSATTDDLTRIISSRLSGPDDEWTETITRIYATERYAKIGGKTTKFVRIALILMVVGSCGLVMNRVHFRRPFCSDDQKFFRVCRPCPAGSKCSKGTAKCPDGQFLSAVGCRKKSFFRLYRDAARGARFISRRDGDCVTPAPPISAQEFLVHFPKINLEIYQREAGFNIIYKNGTLISTAPSFPFVCRFVARINEHQEFVGLILFALVGWLIVWLVRRNRAKKMEDAKELAKQAQKILSMTDRPIYMYDIRAQLRVKNQKIDELWKYVVRFIEDDSHIVSQVVGARHEAYWKWIASPERS
jgi:hypothetical protein